MARTARKQKVEEQKVAARSAAAGADAPGRADDKENGVVIQGKRVRYPVVVRDAISASVTWVVDANAARALLPANDLDVIEIWPGKSLFTLACIDYRDNDLGDYNEVSFTLFVREKKKARGLPYLGDALRFFRGRAGTFIVWLPVDQAFTREAGETMWGFPKTMEQIRFDHHGDRASCKLVSRGRHVLTLSMPKGGTRELPENEMTTYTLLDERTAATRFVSKSHGVGFYRSGVELELGEHPMATELRNLGLPKKPLTAVWMQHMSASFDAARVL